jgi:hypothetical protein
MRKNYLRLIVIVPHRDALKAVNTYRRKLFEHGFSGAYSFPGIIPLFVTKKPYTLTELKQTAFSLKKIISSHNPEGKFFSKQVDLINSLPQFSLGGLSFDISLDGLSIKKDDTALPRFLLGLTFLKAGTEESFLMFTNNEPPPFISFRACSVANMIYSVSDDSTFSWEIGHPVWLPSMYKGNNNG